jgi:hypothetical protein
MDSVLDRHAAALRLHADGRPADAVHELARGRGARRAPGAEQVLRHHRPQLAIAIYHTFTDWTDIPAFLDGLGVGYRHSLGHFTVRHGESVRFAWCEA